MEVTINYPKGKYAWSVKVGEKGQIVIPKEARDIFDINPGDTLIVLGDKMRGIAIPPKSTLSQLIETIIGGTIPQEDNENETATQFGLESVLSKKAKHLSGGMQRRLSIAMALISNPQILFLDEPTLGLDIFARRELWASIQALKGKVTILLTTHYMEEAEALSDCVGVMADGKLTAVGTVEELTAQTNTTKLEDAFVVLAGGTL